MKTTPISMEQLNQFHIIHKDMYVKLVFSLHYDPLMSLRIISFWLWLECSGICRNFISNLHSITSILLNSIALETISYISYIDNSILSHSINIFGLTCLQRMVKNNTFSLSFLINNRATVLNFMQKIYDSVMSSRALDNLLSQCISTRGRYQRLGSMFHSGSSSSTKATVLTSFRVQRHLIRGMGPRRSNILRIFRDPRKISKSEEQEKIVTVEQTPQHERIVILTFCKSSHITESQLRDFFVGRFGEIIEDLIMQDVPQPHYARMLIRSSNGMEKILRGQNCIKFFVNGKHVYARKYVKSNPKASTTGSSSHQQSPPPSPQQSPPQSPTASTTSEEEDEEE